MDPSGELGKFSSMDESASRRVMGRMSRNCDGLITRTGLPRAMFVFEPSYEGSAVAAAWQKLFGLELEYLGAIVHDDEAWRAVRKRRPVLLENPESNVAKSVVAIAGKLLAADGRTSPAP